MSAPVFRHSGPFIPGSTVVLDGPEGHHAATVVRMAPGEEISLVDGAGARADGTVVEVVRDRLTIAVRHCTIDPEPALRIIAAQALLKGEHGELAVDQLTQVGADVIVPWLADRSQVSRAAVDRVLGKSALRIAAAAKQSRRARWPQLVEPVTTVQLAELVRSADVAIVLHEGADQAIAECTVPTAGTVLLIVGPEGGIADAERAALTSAGACERRLGPTILRGSLAGAVACAALLAGTRWAGAAAPEAT